VDIKDATLIFLAESDAYPSVAEIAQSACDRLVEGGDIDYRALSHLLGEASGKGVPIRSSRTTWQPGEDPLTAGVRARY
jgi:hypothetical protein